MKTLPEVTALKEKIVLCQDFAPWERDLLLDSLNFGDYSGKHKYPSTFPPGKEKWSTAAWAVLDQMRPDAMPVRDRFMLGGLIAGALQQVYEQGRKS
jgi:hypothetical protein